MEVVAELSQNNEYTFAKAGLRSNAISQIIRKHMDERRRKETESSQNTGASTSDMDDTESSPDIGNKTKSVNYEGINMS